MTYEVISRRTAPALRISEPSDAFEALKRYSRRRQEHFLLMTLNGAQQVIRLHLVTIGILNRTLVHPREVFTRAVKDSAASLIIAHNHPSGDLEPSREDKDVTQRMADCGRLMGMEVVDHIIFSSETYYSFREAGLMPNGRSWASTFGEKTTDSKES